MVANRDRTKGTAFFVMGMALLGFLASPHNEVPQLPFWSRKWFVDEIVAFPEVDRETHSSISGFCF